MEPPSDAVGGSPSLTTPARRLWFSYLWLLCGSGYFLTRCLVDLALVRRPALRPNLTQSGLAWLAGTLFVCLVAVAFRQPNIPEEQIGKGSFARRLAGMKLPGM